MAETCRRIGAYAESLGLARPSYSHLRGFIREERLRAAAEKRRKEELAKIVADVYVDLMTGRRVVDAYQVADRIRRAGT